MQAPYKAIDLGMEFIRMINKRTPRKKLEELKNYIEKLLPENKNHLNEKIAEFYKMKLPFLVKNPNYEELLSGYRQAMAYKIVEKIKEVLGMTAKEAWVVNFIVVNFFVS